jgi:preprotein translocase subunit SecE
MIWQIIFLSILVLVALLVAANWRKLQARWLETRKFLREVRVEMQKVTWPTRNDAIGSTIVVMTAVIVLGLIITAWDQVLSWVLHFVLQGKGA